MGIAAPAALAPRAWLANLTVACRNVLECHSFVGAGLLWQAQYLLRKNIAHHLVSAAGQAYAWREQYGFLEVGLLRAELLILNNAGLAK